MTNKKHQKSYRPDRRDGRDRGPRRDDRRRGDNFRERGPERERDFKPRQTKVQRLSGGKPYIKISNLSYEISTDDLKSLLETIGPVSFVDIEYDQNNRSSGIAYAGYVDYEVDNKKAVDEFDGRKAVGQVIDVEEVKPLNILAKPRSEHRPRADVYVPGGVNKNQSNRSERPLRGERPPRRGRANAEDLDKELEEYMNKSNQTEDSNTAANDSAVAAPVENDNIAAEDKMEE